MVLCTYCLKGRSDVLVDHELKLSFLLKGGFFAWTTFQYHGSRNVLWHKPFRFVEVGSHSCSAYNLIHAVSLLRLIKFCNWVSEKVCFSMSDHHHCIYLLLTACFLWKITSFSVKQFLYDYISQCLLLEIFKVKFFL